MILSGQDPAALAQAVQTLARGELLGLPTETVYGLAADATRDEAVAKIFAAKGRPADHPLIARGDAETPALYLAVRRGTEARINRSTWLQLVELADADLCLASNGELFSLVPA